LILVINVSKGNGLNTCRYLLYIALLTQVDSEVTADWQNLYHSALSRYPLPDHALVFRAYACNRTYSLSQRTSLSWILSEA